MNNQHTPIDRHSTVEDMQFIYYKPPVPPVDGRPYIDGIVIGYVPQEEGKEAHLCVHVFKKYQSFNRDIGRTVCRGR